MSCVWGTYGFHTFKVIAIYCGVVARKFFIVRDLLFTKRNIYLETGYLIDTPVVTLIGTVLFFLSTELECV